MAIDLSNLGIVVLIFIVLLIFSILSVRPNIIPGKKQRNWLLILRILLYIVLLIIFLDPQEVIKKKAGQREDFVVLIDNSESVLSYVGDRKGFKNAIKDFMASDIIANLQNNYNLKFFILGNAKAVLKNDLQSFDFPILSLTPLFQSIKSISRYYKQERTDPAGMLLWTDGQDTSIRSKKRINKILTELNFPVNVLVYQWPKDYYDLSVSSVSVDPVNFLGLEAFIEGEINYSGFENREIPVSLLYKEKVIATKKLTLKEGGNKIPFSFTFIPPKEGVSFYKVEIPLLKGEKNVTNNEQFVQINVRRNNIRVLHISGNPSWDTKFLRMALKQDPTIDLIAFYILREHQDDLSIPAKELSLIQFPFDRLFGEEISRFDVIFLQNFTLKKFLVPYTYIDNIGEYVRAGGKLVIIGGEKALTRYDLLGTALGRILPFTLERQHWSKESFRLQLTEAGKNSIFLKRFLEFNPDFFSQISSKPIFSGLNKIGSLKKGVKVLLRAKTQNNSTYPLLIEYGVGRGKIVALLTDSLWTMRFSNNHIRGIGLEYQRFIRYVIEWISDHGDFQPVRVDLKGESVKGDSNVYLRLENNIDRYLQNACPCTITFDIINKGLKSVIKPAENEETILFPLHDMEPGEYPVSIGLKSKGGVNYKFERTFRLMEGSSELFYTYPDIEKMKWLAGVTGGSFLFYKQLGDIDLDKLRFKERKDRYAIIRKVVPLWNNWTVFFLVLMIISFEWGLRRLVEKT